MTGTVLLDKPYMTVDSWPSSPYQDRVYVTWSLFDADGTVYIYGAYSSDYGQTFSGPVLVSTDSASCGNTYGLPTPHGACNENQFSQPFTSPDGTLHVVYNDILLSVSRDGGRRFTGTNTDPRELPGVTSAPGQATTDQWFQWAAFTRSGKLAVSYYDRQYGNDEMTGFSDVSLSGSDDLRTFGVQRVTSASMPPPTQFDGLFWGDYTGLTAGHEAHPIWSDTRDLDVFICQDASGKVTVPPSLCLASAANASLANNQDIYTTGLGVPVR